MKKVVLLAGLFVACLSLQGCVGAIIGTTVDVAIEVAKVPFKVGGAIIDVATGDKDEKKPEQK
jgi:hypothetical protein